ncbi:hypothetical protein FSP39_006820 [Pinctada imbricata]|uniref:Arrestin C-terminal-like domain-containing protein n=1 Tax=Pinctada imbricata TaxID=66713 RepID=A0AA88Y327_PINIB|nr:hypothetical protein FSP39_006820 [Pinctada imbricata]
MFETKVKSFDIVLASPSGIFYGGQQVAGKVVLVVENDLKAREIVLAFQGWAHVHWSERHGSGKNRRTVHYRSNETYFDYCVALVPKGQEDHVLRPGRYEYPFAFNLPPNTPTSFESHTGRVRYMLKANIDRPWAFDTDTNCLITVLTPLDLNATPEATECVYKTPRKSKSVYSTAGECLLGELGENKPMQIHGSRLIVPPLPPSGLIGCNIIDVHYYVQLNVVPSGAAFDLNVMVPLIIGSIPLASTVEQYGVPPPIQQSTLVTPSAPAPPSAPSNIPAPSYAQSYFGPSSIFEEEAQQATETSANAVGPAQEANTWAPSYSYYNWN